MHFPSTKSLIAVLLLLALAAPAAPARAQNDSREMIELQHQVLDLKREVQNLRDQVARGGGSSSGGSFLGGGGRSSSDQSSSGVNDLTAQLLTRVENLEDQVRRLRGRVDEVVNQTQRQGEELTKQVGDLNFRLQALEPGGGAAAQPGASAAPGMAPTLLTGPSGLTRPPGAPAPAGAPAAGPAPAAKRTPEMAIQDGNAALARRDYAAAEAAARDVMNNNKTSPRVYDAQLLLAQALGGRKEFSQAAIAFDDTYKHSRKGVHAQDALLGLATSLTGINEKRAACDTLGQLHTEFPTPRADLRDAITAVRLRAGCH